MSSSDRESGALGIVIAIVILAVAGAGFFFYERTRAMRAAQETAMLHDMLVQQQAELNEAMRTRERLETAAVPITANPQNAPDVETSIRQLLVAQQADWNNGDLDAFMQVYWKSDQLTFASGGKVTRGWQATLDGYKSKYPTKEQLGTLTFDNLEFQSLGDNVMLVLGTWHLERGEKSIGGNFSLIWRRIEDGQWRIVHDHTSVLESK